MKRLRIKRYLPIYGMLLPAFFYFLIFAYYPLIRGFVISLQNFRLLGNRPFVGLENYRMALQDPLFWRALTNTLIIGGGILIFGFLTSLIIALSLNEVVHALFKRFTQTVIYFPHLFSWVVVGGIWIYLLSPDGGFVNELMKLFGQTQPIPFLTREAYARPLMILIAVWKDAGYLSILFLAAIVGINPGLYEAARIDGANRWHQLRYITLPQLVPTMKVVFLLQVMSVLRIFDQIFMLSNAVIYDQVNVLMTYVYEKGIQQFKLGIASAVAFLVLAATLILTLIIRKLIRYEEEWERS